MNLYLINQMTFAHLTSNSMLCDNTFLCPRTLFSSPISSWLGSPQPREATKLSLFQPPGVHKEPKLGQNHQSHLCSCLDDISPRTASPSTSAAASGCSIPRLWGCSCVTLLVSTKRTADFHSQVTSPKKNVLASALLAFTPCQVTSQDVFTNAPLTFTHKVLSHLKKVLANTPLTFTHKSTHLPRHACKCTIDFHSQVTPLHFIPFGKARHCGTVLFLWHSHLALGRTLLFPICGAVSHSRYCHKVPHRVALYSFLSCLWRKFQLE